MAFNMMVSSYLLIIQIRSGWSTLFLLNVSIALRRTQFLYFHSNHLFLENGVEPVEESNSILHG